MEEEGTEILFRPGTETILKEHFYSQVKASGGGELNLLQYCTTEEAEEVRRQQKEVTSTADSNGEAEGKLASLSIIEEQERQPESTNRAFFPSSTRGQPKQSTSVAESDENEGLDQGDNSEKIDRFHPALKAALYTEGQEAVWHEDQYTTVSSVYVKPEMIKATSSLSNPQEKPRNRMKVPFFKSLGKKKQPNEPTTRPVKIHVKKKMIARAVLLLPPKGAGAEIMESTEENCCNNDNREKEKLMKENEIYAEISENTIHARRLLDSVLSGEGLDEEESERLAKEAFTHAATARRIAYRSGYDVIESGELNDGQGIQEAIELEHVMSYLAEEGEQAVLQHRQQQMDKGSDEENNEDEEDQEGEIQSDANDHFKIENDVSAKVKRKRRGKFVVSDYASRAVHYLESIIPKTIANNIDDGAAKGAGGDIPNDKLQTALSSAEDFWSEAGISTLGMRNDTLEYGFSTDEGGDDPGDGLVHDRAGLPRNFDMISLSSLNEILDGGGTINEQKLSPRTAVPEIGIPRKKKTGGPPPTQPKRNRGGILGLVTPRTTRSTTAKKKKHVVGDEDTNSEKKWGGFFKTPRGSEAVPSQLHLVLEETDEDQVEDQNDKETSPTMSGSAQENLVSAANDANVPDSTQPSNKRDEEAVKEDLIEADSDSWLGIPKDSRYSPACDSEELKDKPATLNRYRSIPQDNEIELKLSVVTPEDQQKDILDDHNIGVDSQDADSERKDDIDETHQEDRIDLSISNDTESNSMGDRYRYQTEPIGKTPKRAGLEVEENCNRKTMEDERNIEENTMKKDEAEEQGDLNLPNQVEDKEYIEKHPQSTESKVVKSESNVDVKDKNLGKNTSHEKSKMKVMKGKHDEMSIAASEGSKSKLFGRVVDMIGRNKRKPLVPNTVVEETFVVKNDNKNVSTSLHNIHEATNAKVIAGSETQPKPTVGQRAKAISKMNKSSTGPSSYSVVGDSNTVIEQAISNGNMKAVETNEEGDDVVPLNYLAVMLKKKLDEEKRKTSCDAPVDREPPQQQFLDQQPDADSFVAAIRGARQIEAPGVALEEIAIRNCSSNRDPTTGDGTNEIIVDLAPTPRRSEHGSCFDGDDEDDEVDDEVDDEEDEITKVKTRDPPIKDEEDERQRRKMITERLFQAGNTSFQDENMPGKGMSGDEMKTVPTVESVESYDEEPAESSAKVSSDETQDLEILEKGVRESNSHAPSGHGRRKISISFLKGSKWK